MAGAAFLRLLPPLVTGTELLAASVSPGGEFAAITGDEEVIEVDEAQFEGAGDETSKEDRLENVLVTRERGEITIAFEDSGQGREWHVASQDAANQAINDVLVRT